VTTHADLADAAARWLAAGRPAAVVAVTATQGSVPREAGTRMLVGADAVLGTIGGGHLEFEAIALARGLLAKPSGVAADAAPIERRFALGPSLGQCCGGVVHLRIAPLAADPPALWPPPPPRFTLLLCGAGHVGRAIAALLATLPCRVRWLDARQDEFPAAPGPAHIERSASDDLPAEVAAARAGAFVLVLTHSHALDLEIVHAALRRPELGFVGLIGSRSKRARFEHRLRDRGIDGAALQRLVCPIGLPGITGKEPEVIALAVVAQLMALQAPACRHPARCGEELMPSVPDPARADGPAAPPPRRVSSS
jgi:xanthine dehydrogenase accessory factor